MILSGRISPSFSLSKLNSFLSISHFYPMQLPSYSPLGHIHRYYFATKGNDWCLLYILQNLGIKEYFPALFQLSISTSRGWRQNRSHQSMSEPSLSFLNQYLLKFMTKVIFVIFLFPCLTAVSESSLVCVFLFFFLTFVFIFIVFSFSCYLYPGGSVPGMLSMRHRLLGLQLFPYC